MTEQTHQCSATLTHQGKDINGQSYSFYVPDLHLAGTIRSLMISPVQPGIPYGNPNFKNKQIYLEGDNIVLFWAPNKFYIDMKEGHRYVMTHLGFAEPPVYELALC